MRHFRSVLYTLVLAPAVWILCGVGFTQGLTGRARDATGSVETISAMLLLVLAGAAYAILLFSPISPLGPALAGAAFVGLGVWGVMAPDAYGSVWPAAVTREGFDLSRPGYALTLLLGVPLLCTALSARRWSRYEPPQLPLIGTLGRARATAAAPGIPVSADRTEYLDPNDPTMVVPTPRPAAPSDPTVAIPTTHASSYAPPSPYAPPAQPPPFAPPAAAPVTPAAAPDAQSPSPFGPQSFVPPPRDADDEPPTTVIADTPAPAADEPSAEKTEPVEPAEDEPTTGVVTGDEPTAIVTSEEPTAAVPSEEPTAAVPSEEPTAAVTGDESTAQVVDEPPTAEVTGDEPTEAVESHEEKPREDEAPEAAPEEAAHEQEAAAEDEPTTAFVVDGHGDATPPANEPTVAPPSDENTEFVTTEARDSDDNTEPMPAEASDSDDRDAAERNADAQDKDAQDSDAQDAGRQDADATTGVVAADDDPGERTQVISPAAVQRELKTRDLSHLVRPMEAGPGEQTQIILRRPANPADAKRTSTDADARRAAADAQRATAADAQRATEEAELERDRIAQEKARQAFKDLAAQERARQAFAERAAQQALEHGEATQVIDTAAVQRAIREQQEAARQKAAQQETPAQRDRHDDEADRTQVLGKARGAVSTAEPEETPAPQVPQAPPSISESERPDPAADPTTRLQAPPPRAKGEGKEHHGRSLLDQERPADEVADDPTRRIKLPTQRAATEDEEPTRRQ